MKILICPAMMEIGGSQTNAIELAHGVARLGHEVVLFGPDGVLLEIVRELNLDYEVAPRERAWPTRANMAAVTRLVSEREIDVVHGYEWGPAMDLAFGPHLISGVPLVITVLSMKVPDFLPRHCPLVVGTAELELEHSATHRSVNLMEPPIDTERNSPHDPLLARSRFGFSENEFVAVMVGRLVADLDKLRGALEAISAVDALAVDTPIRLLIVGDGNGLAGVRASAAAVNRVHGRDVVVVTGALLDPRDAYDAADVVLGMGSSALKGMAFGKPLVVQGAAGFWMLLDESTVPMFLKQGWYGEGGGGSAELALILRRMHADPARRALLGGLGRSLVVDRFSLAQASRDLVDIYSAAMASRPRRVRSVVSLSLSAARFSKFKFALWRHRWVASSRLTLARSRP